LRAILQRVRQASVTVDHDVVGMIGPGWAILLGVGPHDDERAAADLVERIVTLRAFADSSGKMNLSATEVQAEFLVVSQVTLYCDLSRGRRPSFAGAAPPALADALVRHFADLLRDRGFRVATGRFGAMMEVEIHNDGPVTFALSTDGWS
jgi:D-aminoacyl-tRNA deacylase